MLDAFGADGRKVLQVHVSWAPTDEEALRDRARPVAHERLRPADLLGPRDARGLRRRRHSSCARRTCASKVLVSLRPRAARRVAAGVRGARLRRHRAPPRRPGPRRVHRRVRRARPPGAAHEHQGDQRPVVEGRRLLLPRRRDVPTTRRRRLRRPARADRARRLPRRPRHQLPVADAVLPVAQPRRRLRHHRLLRRRAVARHARRLHRAGPHLPRPRHPRDRRLRDEPHVRPAPVVPGGALEPGLAVPRLLRVERRAAAREARRRRLPRPGDLELGLRPQGRPVLPAQVLFAPAGPQPGQPRGPRRARAGDGASGCSRACAASASTPCRS